MGRERRGRERNDEEDENGRRERNGINKGKDSSEKG
jgi:hypothetical protein